MKTMILLAALSLTATVSLAAETKKEETPTAKAPEALQPQAAQGSAANAPKKKTTDVSFEDVLVQGKYHFSDEAVTTVEQDKILDALLGVRQDFKDRLKKSAARH